MESHTVVVAEENAEGCAVWCLELVPRVIEKKEDRVNEKQCAGRRGCKGNLCLLSQP